MGFTRISVSRTRATARSALTAQLPLLFAPFLKANIPSTLSLILKSEGFEVQIAESAQSAKEYVSKLTCDLLVTDLSLEQPRSRFELVRFANLQPSKPASVVIRGFHDLLAHWQEYGADAGIEKPTDVAELLATISRLLSDRAKENGKGAV